jgi:2-aminobenzoate-CoA ligase
MAPRSAHLDGFARDNLPPREQWPVFLPDHPGLGYPERLNCAAELLDKAVAAGAGTRRCLLFPGGEWSYAELLDKASRIARVLAEDLGLVPGNRVLLRAPNHPMMVACWFAVLKAGGIAVATMPLLRARELRYILEKAQVQIALCDERLLGELSAAAAAAPLCRAVLPVNSASPQGLEARMAAKPPSFATIDTAADDVALIAFTSGTTGAAKGTVHFHRDLLAVSDGFPKSILRAGPEDLFCGSPPLAFTFGLGGLVLFPLRLGASALLLERAAPAALLEAIARHRATICFTAPTAYRAMADLAGGYDLSSLRRCVAAGEALPLSTWEAWRQATGLRIIDGIGSTEMLHIFISAAEEAIRPGATGKPIPGYEAMVVDEAFRPLPPGRIGRLAVRGPTGCRYLADERQKSYVQQGWNLTGDAYRTDADGYFWFEARTDDMIVSAGYNISGPEIEEVLLAHPAVAECAVVASPDDERGFVPKAFIVLRGGHAAGDALAAALQDLVKAELAPYKYPRAIEFIEVLPRTETGKVQRFVLRQRERQRAERDKAHG